MKRSHLYRALALCAAFMLMLAACSTPAPTPATVADYETYESTELGLKLQYPSEWLLVEGGLTQDEIEAAIEVYGEDVQSIIDNTDLSGLDAMWYDLQAEQEGFTTNMNLIVSDSAGLAEKDLKDKSSQKQLQESYESEFTKMYDSYKTIADMKGQQIGARYYIVFQCGVSFADVDMEIYQAMTIKGSKLFTFTYTTRGQVSSAITTLESILSTVEVS